ncbi:MAG: hypothetical protein EOP47_13835 [Sphingobacteriaceae bacterium]|nr:MAG: hypothetical protein EOP47_13835 [Sphingobacteriaceae bacterium]
MKKIKYIIYSCLAALTIYGCEKDRQTDFKDFLGDKEIIYPGAAGQVTSQVGDLRVKLKWKASTDPSITKYIIYWNSRTDSQIVNVTTKVDSISTVIDGLNEYTYSFTIFSADVKGNRSIAKEVNNVKVYGPTYTSGLLNRGYDAVSPYVVNADGTITMHFITPDTININTEIKYTNAVGMPVSLLLPPDQNNITLPDYKSGTAVTYRSSYIPERGAIDTFYVNQFDEFPQIERIVPCDKSLFRATNRPNDVRAEYGTTIDKLWDGSVGPQGYPNIFHSNEETFPHQLTIDLGKVYGNLYEMEETGRDCCHNPDQFEVWGNEQLNDTDLRANQSGWREEAIAKGWTLLADVVRNDNGNAAFKFQLNNNGKPIRYIKLRIKKTANNNPNSSNISEISLWNKE